MNNGNNNQEIVINGLQAINNVEKIISKKIDFSYNDLDQADQIRNSLDVVKTNLVAYNRLMIKIRNNNTPPNNIETSDTGSIEKVSEESDE